MNISNPFTQDDKRAIEESIRMLNNMIPLVQKAKNCGVECAELEHRINNNLKRLNQFYTQFFPSEAL